MGLTLDPRLLRRYRDLAWLLIRHGRSDLVKRAGLEDALASDRDSVEKTRDGAQELARGLERLGPTFVKLGQLLSTRPDFLPRSGDRVLRAGRGGRGGADRVDPVRGRVKLHVTCPTGTAGRRRTPVSGTGARQR